MRKVVIAACAAVVGTAGAAAAAPLNLVHNGGFESLTGPANEFIGYGVSELTDWFYNAAPTPNAAVYTFAGANGSGAQQGSGGGLFPLYGPGNGFNNGFVASPAGGNFLASDGEAAFQGSFNQTISGLTSGHSYTLSFVWAGNQFLDSNTLPDNGTLTIDWQVSLGGETFTTPVESYTAHDFTGWLTQSFTYTATNPSEVLSLLAQGMPNGLPPVALLDGVSLTVPEPASWSLIILGIAGLGAVARKRRRSAEAP